MHSAASSFGRFERHGSGVFDTGCDVLDFLTDSLGAGLVFYVVFYLNAFDLSFEGEGLVADEVWSVNIIVGVVF